MRRLIYPNAGRRITAMSIFGVVVFLTGYLGWAFYTTSVHFSNAIKRSEQQAHTIVGQEGYEYIFDPTTQIYIDRIKPNRRGIISYLVLKNYLPSLDSHRCTYSDSETCRWINLNIQFSSADKETTRKMLFLSSGLGILAAGGLYFLSTLASSKRN